MGVINKLKRKAIHDFDHLVKRLEKGYKIKYNDLYFHSTEFIEKSGESNTDREVKNEIHQSNT